MIVKMFNNKNISCIVVDSLPPGAIRRPNNKNSNTKQYVDNKIKF